MLTPPGRALLERWIYVLVKVGPAFVLPYSEARLAQVLAAPGYGADFPPLLARVLDALAASGAGGWAAGSYYPGGWYRQLTARGGGGSAVHSTVPSTVAITPDALAPFYQDELRVDAQGRWSVGAKPVAGRVLAYFLRHLHYDGEVGRYVVRYPLERHEETRYLHHHSPPIRVHRVQVRGGAVTLRLNTGAEAALRPETLRMDAAEQLYCAVLDAGVPAWFSEPARWALLKDAEPPAGDGGAWRLPVDGGVLSAPLHAPWAYAHGAGEG